MSFSEESRAAEEFLGDSPWGTANVPDYTRDTCPHAPHRAPEGPNEDVGQCPWCWSLSWELRPEGQTFGHHLSDCSLPVRHESYCQPGGSGHPPAETVRGYFGPGSEES